MTGVRWLACTSAEVPAGEGWLSARERLEASGFHVPARRDGFRLRRWTGRLAVAHALGLERDPRTLSRIGIGRESLGAPLAFLDGTPVPIAISLTDRAGRAVCAVGPPRRALGCDLERIEPRSAAFVLDFLTEDEQRFVAAGSGEERDLRVALVWSAKESALKALHLGLRLDTRSVEITPSLAPVEGGWGELVVTATAGHALAGWWRREEDLVLTVAGDPPLPLPVRLAAAARPAREKGPPVPA